MNKLAIAFLSVAFTGGVALACPHEDAKSEEAAAPKTAQTEKKADDKAKPAEKPVAKEADKAKTAKPEPKKDEKKPADKVSQK
jgi:hypothetical protein